jgi:hypothetical protein
MREGVYDDADREVISLKLHELGILDSIREIARSFALTARKNLDILPQTGYRLALDEIPNFVIDRNS